MMVGLVGLLLLLLLDWGRVILVAQGVWMRTEEAEVVVVGMGCNLEGWWRTMACVWGREEEAARRMRRGNKRKHDLGVTALLLLLLQLLLVLVVEVMLTLALCLCVCVYVRARSERVWFFTLPLLFDWSERAQKILAHQARGNSPPFFLCVGSKE